MQVGNETEDGSFMLKPDVLDQQDVLTMNQGDPNYAMLQNQLFSVKLHPNGKVRFRIMMFVMCGRVA